MNRIVCLDGFGETTGARTSEARTRNGKQCKGECAFIALVLSQRRIGDKTSLNRSKIEKSLYSDGIQQFPAKACVQLPQFQRACVLAEGFRKELFLGMERRCVTCLTPRALK